MPRPALLPADPAIDRIGAPPALGRRLRSSVRPALREEVAVQLYSGSISLFTAKVRVALDEKQLAYERTEVGWSLEHRYEPHHPDVVRLNPQRKGRSWSTATRSSAIRR